MTKTKFKTIKIDEKIVQKHGINREEYNKILGILNREPNITELGIFSAMFSIDDRSCSWEASVGGLGSGYGSM